MGERGEEQRERLSQTGEKKKKKFYIFLYISINVFRIQSHSCDHITGRTDGGRTLLFHYLVIL